MLITLLKCGNMDYYQYVSPHIIIIIIIVVVVVVVYYYYYYQ